MEQTKPTGADTATGTPFVMPRQAEAPPQESIAVRPPVTGAPVEPAVEATPWFRRRKLLVALFAVAAVVGALVGLGVGALINRSASFTVTGEVSLANGYGTNGCQGSGENSDLHEGALVTVYDGAGRAVGTGSLGQGTPVGQACTFPFQVTGVPTGSDQYAVEVASRGRTTYNADSIESGHLTLGVQ